MLFCASDPDPPTLLSAPNFRSRNVFCPRKIGSRYRFFRRDQVLELAANNDLTTMLTSARTNINYPVRPANRFLVVLDNDKCVPQVAQSDQGGD